MELFRVTQMRGGITTVSQGSEQREFIDITLTGRSSAQSPSREQLVRLDRSQAQGLLEFLASTLATADSPAQSAKPHGSGH